jgi:hypothetical protein
MLGESHCFPPPPAGEVASRKSGETEGAGCHAFPIPCQLELRVSPQAFLTMAATGFASRSLAALTSGGQRLSS